LKEIHQNQTEGDAFEGSLSNQIPW